MTSIFSFLNNFYKINKKNSNKICKKIQNRKILSQKELQYFYKNYFTYFLKIFNGVL